MTGPLTSNTTIPLLARLVQFNEKRHEAITSNIAGIQTPGYKSRDLPVAAFQQALTQAARKLTTPQSPFPGSFPPNFLPIELPVSPVSPGTSVESIDALFPDELFASETIPESELSLQDGGKRSIEHEIMEMRKTLLLQSFALQLINTQYGMLQTVISERLA